MRARGWIIALCLAAATAVRAAEPAPPPKPAHGIAHRILMYLPNRVLDLADIFRLRARVGPGLGLHVRATEHVGLFAGSYRSVYAGLPGPRTNTTCRLPVGREDLKGLALMGVEATDDTPHHPAYSRSEFDVGVHALILGVEAGVDPVQAGDFLAGFLGLDPSGDDR